MPDLTPFVGTSHDPSYGIVIICIPSPPIYVDSEACSRLSARLSEAVSANLSSVTVKATTLIEAIGMWSISSRRHPSEV
jgi:hypothetical protein